MLVLVSGMFKGPALLDDELSLVSMVNIVAVDKTQQNLIFGFLNLV